MICLFLFHDKSYSKIANLWPSKIKHVELIKYDTTGCFKFTIAKNGIGIVLIKEYEPHHLFEILQRTPSLLHSVMVDIKETKKRSPLCLIYTCSEIARYLSKIDLPFCLIPSQLHKNLLTYSNSRNYEVLQSWSRPDAER